MADVERNGEETDEALQTEMARLRTDFSALESCLHGLSSKDEEDLLVSAADKRRAVIKEQLAHNHCEIAYCLHMRRKYATRKLNFSLGHFIVQRIRIRVMILDRRRKCNRILSIAFHLN